MRLADIQGNGDQKPADESKILAFYKSLSASRRVEMMNLFLKSSHPKALSAIALLKKSMA
jgi:hypothetical protein